MMLVLIAFTLSIAAISGFSGGASKTQAALTRNEFTESLLLTVLHCTADTSGYEGMTLSDLAAAYFRNQSLNSTLTDEIKKHVGPYAAERKLEWVMYANHTEVIWVPFGARLSGGEISSASARIPLADNTSATLYLFMRWD
jgi:hypothetical protein